MKLEVNKSHKGIRFEKLKKPLKRFTAGVAGLALAISLYSGATAAIVDGVYDERPAIVWTINDESVEIPDYISDEIAYRIGKEPGDPITSSDLDKITFLTVEIDDDVKSLEFLKYFNNLKIVYIFLQTDNIDVLKDLSYSNSIVDVAIMSRIFDYHTLDKDKLSFIGESSSIKKLSISEYTILSPGCEEELNKLDTLEIMSGTNYDIDFSKLDHLKVLDLSLADPYDIAIYLNTNEYNNLISKGVEIKFSDENAKKKYLDACSKLDDIVKKLDIDENASTSDKMNAILIYVLENLEYDEEISNLVQNNRDTDDEASKFYEDGHLYGALYKDSAICGNYAALTEALMDRLDVPQNSFYATSSTHAWNVIRIDGEPYYVDATWLDKYVQQEPQTIETYDDQGRKVVTITYKSVPTYELIKEGKVEDLTWYKEKIDDEHISSIDNEKESHDVNYLPDYVTKVDESNDNKDVPKDVTDDKVKVKIGTKEIIIGAGALVGVLGAVGGGIFAIRKKKQNEERKRRQRMMMDNDYYSSSYYDSNYSSNRRRY